MPGLLFGRLHKSRAPGAWPTSLCDDFSGDQWGGVALPFGSCSAKNRSAGPALPLLDGQGCGLGQSVHSPCPFGGGCSRGGVGACAIYPVFVALRRLLVKLGWLGRLGNRGGGGRPGPKFLRGRTCTAHLAMYQVASCGQLIAVTSPCDSLSCRKCSTEADCGVWAGAGKVRTQSTQSVGIRVVPGAHTPLFLRQLRRTPKGPKRQHSEIL